MHAELGNGFPGPGEGGRKEGRNGEEKGKAGGGEYKGRKAAADRSIELGSCALPPHPCVLCESK